MNKQFFELEDKFIRLRSEGKSIEIIANMLRLSKDILLEWENNLIEARKLLTPEGPFERKIVGKDEEGQYIINHSLQIQSPLVNVIRFKLWSVFSSEIETAHMPEQEIQKVKEMQDKAKLSYSLISKYVEAVSFKDNWPLGDFVMNYNLTTQDAKISEDVKEALSFYFMDIHRNEEMARKEIILEESEDVYHSSNASPMPFALKRLVIENFNGVLYTSIEKIPVDTQWLFLTGENGFGKTTILQAMVVGLLGHRDEDTILVDNPESKIGIEFKNDFINQINNLRNPPSSKPSIVAYGSSRLLIQSPQSQNEIARQSSITYSLFNSDGVLLNIEIELYKWFLKKDKKFNSTRKLFKSIIPGLADITVDKDKDTILYTERDHNSNNFEPVPFKKLASGFKSILAMIGDMLIRFYHQNPDITDPKQIAGFAFIDEFDLHLHPKWQRELPYLLSKAFPRVQFIVSTHSVIPFLGAPKKSVFLKVTRNAEQGILLNEIDIDIKNLLPNAILTSSIFDMDSITQRNHTNLKEVRTEDYYADIAKNNQVKRKLEDFEKNGIDIPDDLFSE